MYRNLRPLFLSFFAVLWLTDFTIAQPEPTPTPTVPTPGSAAAAATPETSYWKQPYLTGDWGGTRTEWRQKGVDLQFRLTQGYQVRATGSFLSADDDADGFYAGKFDTNFTFDMGKLAGIKGLSVQIKTETRFGKVAGGTLALIPHTAFAITPRKTGTVFSVTAFNFTQLFPLDLKKGNLIAVGAGKYSSLDSVKEPFWGGGGHTTFLNVLFNAPPASGQLVPIVSNGATFAWIRRGSPFVTFAMFDANESTTRPGLGNLASKGVTFVPGINFYSKFGGKSGKHSFSGAVTTREKTPFDEIGEIIIPGGPTRPLRAKKGSWVGTYMFNQYLKERTDSKTGWGLFGYAQVADRSTNPLAGVFTIGLGGNGIFESRLRDRFGIAYGYVAVSRTLKREISPLLPLGNEQVFETFYNFSITPFISLAGSLQVVDPAVRLSDVAVIPGGRLVINF